MKRLTTAVLAAVLLFSSAEAAAAASAPKPIQVTLNGQALKFEVQPTSIDSTTFVEFRSLFAALGYTIDYAAKTKTIRAVSDEHEIQMSLGGDVAFVDGASVPINGQLVSQGGRTLVGVRFIASLSGKEVTWDSATRTVVIVDNGPTAEEKEAVLAFLDRSEQAFNTAELDIDAILALTAEDSPLREDLKKSLEEEKNSSLRTKTTYREASIEEYSDAEAVLYAVEDNVKVSGDEYYFDNTAGIEFVLRPNSQGQWLLYDMYYDWIDYTGDETLIDKTVTVPDSERAAIEAALAAQLKAMNDEDIEAYRATFASAEGLESYFDAIESGLAEYDQRFTAEKTSIVYYNGTDQAVAIRSIVVEDLKDGFKTRFHQGNYLVKKDGKWLFDDSEYVYNIKEIEE